MSPARWSPRGRRHSRRGEPLRTGGRIRSSGAWVLAPLAVFRATAGSLEASGSAVALFVEGDRRRQPGSLSSTPECAAHDHPDRIRSPHWRAILSSSMEYVTWNESTCEANAVRIYRPRPNRRKEMKTPNIAVVMLHGMQLLGSAPSRADSCATPPVPEWFALGAPESLTPPISR